MGKFAKHKWPLLFTGTNILLFTTFFLVPAVLGLYYSFTDSNGYPGESFIGLANYSELFQDASFYKALGRTFTYVLWEVPLVYMLSLSIALLLTSPRTRGKLPTKLIFFLPWTVSGIIVGVMWRWLFSENFGFINYVIEQLGGNPIAWFSEGNNALAVIIIAAAWGGTAFNMLIFMAALKNIPQSLYEAAEIDGANRLQKFRFITFPALKPTSFMVVLLATIGSMKEFVMVQALTEGGPGTDNVFLVQYIYQTGFDRRRVGYASAASMVLFVILMVLALIQLKAGGKKNE